MRERANRSSYLSRLAGGYHSLPPRGWSRGWETDGPAIRPYINQLALERELKRALV